MVNVIQSKGMGCAVAISLAITALGCSEPSADVGSVPKADSAVVERVGTESNEAVQERSAPEIPPPLNDQSCVAFLTNYGAGNDASKVMMSTEWGEIVIHLFEDVPLHRANFLYLIERNYYSPSQIVRVVPDFVIQGGNSEEVEDQRKRAVIGDHTLPAEFRPHRIHRRGAVAMSRSYIDNPKKRSSAYDFYIVIGSPVNAATLHTTTMENGMNYSKEQKELYATIGGAPHLDNEHTVFGEVIKGMEVVETISRLDRDASDWPVEHVEFTLKTVE